MSLSFFPRPKHEPAAEREAKRTDSIERRLSRQEEDLVAREAALNERERQVRKRERAVEQEASGSSPEDTAMTPDVEKRPGATAPGRDMAAFILRAQAIAQGTADNTALPVDKSARLIAMAARGELPEPERNQPNATARMILNADLIRRGGDVEDLR